MSEGLTIVAALVGGLAGLGGLAAGIYYVVRLSEWWGERTGGVSLEIISKGFAGHSSEDHIWLTVTVRLFNPKATARCVTYVGLNVGAGMAAGLSVLGHRGTEWLPEMDQVELQPKRYSQLTLGTLVPIDALRGNFREYTLAVDLDDGQRLVASLRTDDVDWKSAFQSSVSGLGEESD